MKQALWHFMTVRRVLARPEGDGSGDAGSGGGGSFSSVADAVAELDRRESERRASNKAAKAEKEAKAAPKPAPEPDDDDSGDDYQEPKPRKDEPEDEDKPKKKAKPEPKAEDADDDDADDDEGADDDDESDEAPDGDDSDDGDDPKKRVRATDDEEGSDADADLEEIEHDGKKHRVPKELKDAFLRQSDYTRKTQEVAEARRQVEQTWAEAQHTAQQLVATQQALAQFAQSAIGQAPDLSLAQTDPQAYLVQKGLYEQRVAQVQSLMEQGQMLTQQQQAMTQRAQQQYLAEQSNLLLQAIPELRDEAKRSEFRKTAITTAQKYGFSEAELSAVADHRMLLVLRDLAQAQKAASRSADAQASVKKKLANVPPKTARPMASNGDNRSAADEAKREFKRSGRSMKDVRRYLERTER